MTNSAPAKSLQRKEERLADHWYFSTETAFRIPELLDDLRHELRRSDIKVLKGILPGSNIHMEFVRRVLTGPQQENILGEIQDPDGVMFGQNQVRLCYQFTGSYAFERFRISNEADPIDKAFGNADQFITEIKSPVSSLASAWKTCVDSLSKACKANHDTTTVDIINALKEQIDRHKNNPPTSTEDKFRFLSLLYVFYSRLSLSGEAVGTISKHHFADDPNDLFYQGRPRTLGYLLESEPGRMGEPGQDTMLLRINDNGTVSNNLLPQDHFRPITQWFPDSEQLPDSANAKVRDIVFNLWPIFNSTLKPSDKFYDLVIPVYENDALDDQGQMVVTGAFLGWLFIRLEPETVKSIIHPLSQHRGADYFPSISENGGQLPDNALHDIKSIRFALNRFSAMYLQGEMEWAMEQSWGATRDAAEFTCAYFYHRDGWLGQPEIRPNEKLFRGEYCAFCTLEDGDPKPFMIGAYNKPALITHLVVDAGRMFSFAATSVSQPALLVFRKREDTALPTGHDSLHKYARHISNAVRQMYDAAKLRLAEQKEAREAGWEEHLEAVSHEARRLIRRVRKSERGYVLDVIRQYFHSLLFSDSTSDRITGGGITPEKVRLQLGIPFAEETNCGEFLRSMLRQAAAIEYLGNLGSASAPLFRTRLEKRVNESINACDWSEVSSRTIAPGYSDKNYPKKVLVACALVCVFRNILKHRDEGRPKITIRVGQDDRTISITNYGRKTTNSVGVLSYSTVRGGTYGAVSRYIKHYLSPDDSAMSLLCMPGSSHFRPDDNGLFTSTLPLPADFLCTKHI